MTHHAWQTPHAGSHKDPEKRETPGPAVRQDLLGSTSDAAPQWHRLHHKTYSQLTQAHRIVDLMAITAREARKNLFPLIEQVNRDHSTVRITSKSGDAVLMSADDYNSWQETVYLLRSPENARRLMEAVSRDKAATPDGVLDAGYAHLAAEFNSEPANAERRAARSRYAALAQEYDDFYGEGAQAPMSDVTAHLFRSPENARRLLDAAAALDRRLTATATWLEELPESSAEGATHQQALDALDAAREEFES